MLVIETDTNGDTEMTNLTILRSATTVAGNGNEDLAGYVLRNEATGQREWIEGASFTSARKIISRRTGTWTARGFGIVNGQAFIYA
jgi:hypothetical protein